MRLPWRNRRAAPSPSPSGGAPLEVEVSAAPYGARVTIAGELDLATVPRVRAALAEEPVAGARAVVVDLSGVTFMDSTGISALLELERDLGGRGGRLAIACPEGPARLLLDVTGVTKRLGVQRTREGAEAAVA